MLFTALRMESFTYKMMLLGLYLVFLFKQPQMVFHSLENLIAIPIMIMLSIIITLMDSTAGLFGQAGLVAPTAITFVGVKIRRGGLQEMYQYRATTIMMA